jgi:hypothetical protein
MPPVAPNAPNTSGATTATALARRSVSRRPVCARQCRYPLDASPGCSPKLDLYEQLVRRNLDRLGVPFAYVGLDLHPEAGRGRRG